MTTALDPKNNRLEYSSVLEPPANYEVMYAIGTTYSLDLDSLLAVCLSLGLDVDVDNQATRNPICLLNAIRKLIGKIVIFCEQGQIKGLENIKGNKSKLYSIIDQIIVPITLASQKNNHNKGTGNKEYYPAFHSKTWTIIYRSKSTTGESKLLFRFVVLSRNLTFDRSWDTAICLYGEKYENLEPEYFSQTQKILDFLNHLNNHLNKHSNKQSADTYKTRKRTISEVIDKLSNVRFSLEENSKSFGFDILPFFTSKDASENKRSITKENFSKAINAENNLLIMSPFITPDIIEFLSKGGNENSKSRILITRKSELPEIFKHINKNSNNVNAFNDFDPWKQINNDVPCRNGIFVIGDETIINAAYLNDDENELAQPSVCNNDIHAKLFVTDNALFTGSLNATNAAVEYNTETMVKVEEKGIFESIYNSLFQECTDSSGHKYVKSLFQKISLKDFENIEDATDQQSEQNKELELVIKNFSRCNLSAKIDLVSNDNNDNALYKITLHYEIPQEFSKELMENKIHIKLSLISGTSQGESQGEIDLQNNNIVFDNLSISQLTELYCITVSKPNEPNGEDSNKLSSKLSRVISVHTTYSNGNIEDLIENRDTEIFKSIIDTPDKILQYIDLQLSECFDRASIIYEISKSSDSNKGHGSYKITNGLYEKLLMNSHDQQQITEISKINEICKKLYKDKCSEGSEISDQNIELYEKISNFCDAFSKALSSAKKMDKN